MMEATQPFHNPYDQPSLVKRVATPILQVLNAVLPQKAYDAIYFPAFGTYQWTLRSAYAGKIRQARRRGDQTAALKMERVHRVMKYSLVGTPGLEHTHDLAQDLVNRNVPGAFVECGVAQGGCAALIAQVASGDKASRDCWFFDSYEGLPEPTELDFEGGKTGRHIRPLPKGSCLGTIEQVSQLLFEEMKLSREKIHLIKGWFQDTLPIQKANVGPIALLRVDGDWYDSTWCVLENLYDQVSESGYVLIDDYCSCYGAQKATDEFMKQRGINATLVPDGRGGASFQKPLQSAARKVA
ncbi:TylF/MycF/NovP-related O-methyltransferase [Planctomicrobium sp. SH664]|uniref:TylF/MycF/NovP-related O-methyltransferase n=1 Tax=Planctomicrobium sp. SH664 TaxID=3448125 RepID=UPI003F5C5496